MGGDPEGVSAVNWMWFVLGLVAVLQLDNMVRNICETFGRRKP